MKKEIKYFLLKSLIKNSKISLLHKYFFFLIKIKSKSIYSKIKQNNRCTQTGRIKSIIRYTKCSRFHFIDHSCKGNIPGFKRLS